MKQKEFRGIPIVLGGVIPKIDAAVLKRTGVKEVFHIGFTLEDIIQRIKKEDC